jgi:hypothetical protein
MMNEREFAETLAHAIENQSRGAQLRDRPPAEPLPGQRAIAEAAFHDARTRGWLRLPTRDRFVFRWVLGGVGVPFGETARTPGGFEVALAVELHPVELRRVVLHELRHVEQEFTGWRRWLTDVEAEQDAIAFAARPECWDQ